MRCEQEKKNAFSTNSIFNNFTSFSHNFSIQNLAPYAVPYFDLKW